METSLHRQLKEHYVTPGSVVEHRVGRYRIDVARPGLLVEIQLASLTAIRDKIAALVTEHRVLLVKPIIARKTLVKLGRAGGCVIERRLSPKRGQLFDLFDELVHFTRVFPHRRLVLEVPMLEIEEWRYPGHGRRRRHRDNDHEIEDQQLVNVLEVHRFRTASDLCRLLPRKLPKPFHTGHVAEGLGVQRWMAQRFVYCLREMGAVNMVGKQGGALLYERPKKRAA